MAMCAFLKWSELNLAESMRSVHGVESIRSSGGADMFLCFYRRVRVDNVATFKSHKMRTLEELLK